MKKACVFVDGENFRFSLNDLFPGALYTFRKGDYLPDTDWHHFFSSLANQFECELLRTYWYVVEHIDCRPYKIPTDWRLKERDLARWYRERIAACEAKGRLVYSVAFLDEAGNPLPGGARRLRNAVDSQIDVPFETVRRAMRIERRKQPLPAQEEAAAAV